MVAGASDRRMRQVLVGQVAELWMELRRRHAHDMWPRMHGIETWTGSTNREMDEACVERGEDAPFHRSIARAPWISACSVLSTTPANPLLALELQRARAFDVEWFDNARERYLAIAIAIFATPRSPETAT